MNLPCFNNPDKILITISIFFVLEPKISSNVQSLHNSSTIFCYDPFENYALKVRRCLLEILACTPEHFSLILATPHHHGIVHSIYWSLLLIVEAWISSQVHKLLYFFNPIVLHENNISVVLSIEYN